VCEHGNSGISGGQWGVAPHRNAKGTRDRLFSGASLLPASRYPCTRAGAIGEVDASDSHGRPPLPRLAPVDTCAATRCACALLERLPSRVSNSVPSSLCIVQWQGTFRDATQYLYETEISSVVAHRSPLAGLLQRRRTPAEQAHMARPSSRGTSIIVAVQASRSNVTTP
jgi:hypothetical protein